MSSIEYFSISVILTSFITIFAIYYVVNNEGRIRWYLKLRSPNTEVKILIDNIFKKNKFNELKNIWIGYKYTIYFLKFHFILLLTGLFAAIAYPFTDFNSFNLLLIIPLISVIFIWRILLKLADDILKIYDLPTEKLYGNITFFIYTSLIPLLPLSLVFMFILINNFELNLNAAIFIYLSLTFGLYEYIKRFIGFFLPIPTRGIYSTKELIQEINSVHEGKTSIIKEIVDSASEKFVE